MSTCRGQPHALDHVGGSSLVLSRTDSPASRVEAAVADVAREQYVTVLDDARRGARGGEWDVFGDGRSS